MSEKRTLVPFVIAGGTVALLLTGLGLWLHARGQVNKVALSSEPRLVSTIIARAAEYRPSHRYVGTVEPWIEARVGPQFVSAYVDTVLVRPGATVKRGQVIATLDCRNASALNKAIAEQARAISASQVALAKEASRVSSLVPGGYASENDAEMKTAESLKERAQFMSLQAQNIGTQLQVSDCILRAPFDGEVSERLRDPGAFVHPGEAIATVVDRSVVRLVADAPEEDFEDVAAGTALDAKVLATDAKLTARISRRAPSADNSTRTIHFEADVDNQQRTLPVGTTVEISIDSKNTFPATEIPLIAASVKQDTAHLFIVSDGFAHDRDVQVVGEHGSELFVDPSLSPGTEIVTEGRLALTNGDAVSAKAVSP